ncbi:MAG: hypothetical protein U0Z26_17025 [Anaerolineales bacterium]
MQLMPAARHILSSADWALLQDRLFGYQKLFTQGEEEPVRGGFSSNSSAQKFSAIGVVLLPFSPGEKRRSSHHEIFFFLAFESFCKIACFF